MIELLIVVALMTLLTAILLPSYQQYLNQKVQWQAQQQALQLAHDLAKWRGKYLTYAGFSLSQSSLQLSSNQPLLASNLAERLYLPLGSNEKTHHYEIRLSDATGQFVLTDLQANGQGWQMWVVPNVHANFFELTDAHLDSYYLDSLHQRCRYSSAQTVALITSQGQADCRLTW
nr:hypothetical protein MN210_13940 [Psychrobacter sp. PraFG1]